MNRPVTVSVIALAVIVAMTIWEVYDFAVTDEGFRYFLSGAFVAFLVMAALIWREFRHVWRRS
jgi:hypothetical protein